MIGVDTNVLVRFLVQDDPGQGALARDLLISCTSDAPAFVSREAMVELVWVLESAYRFPKGKVADALDGLLSAEEVVVEAPEVIALALERYRNEGADFADQMIGLAGQAAGCSTTFTFDRRAGRFPGMTVLSPSS